MDGLAVVIAHAVSRERSACCLGSHNLVPWLDAYIEFDRSIGDWCVPRTVGLSPEAQRPRAGTLTLDTLTTVPLGRR